MLIMREKSCGAIVFNSSGKHREYLLLHYEAGHWDFIKGHVEKGESEATTAKREAKEESDIDIKILPGFREMIKYFFKKDGKLISKEVVFFVAESKTKKVQLSYEHIGYEWLPFESALNKLTYKNAKDILKKVEKFLKGRLV